MRVLFLHQNFPGQFKHIANELSLDSNNEVIAVGHTPKVVNGIHTIKYEITRGNTKGIHQYLLNTESQILRGQAVAKVLLELKQKNKKPDIIIAHVGWGEALFAKDIFPDVPLIGFFEFFYHAKGADLGFDPEIQTTLDTQLRLRAKNFINLSMLEACDVAVSPTKWQKSLYPTVYQDKIKLLHEGVDTTLAAPNPNASVQVNETLKLTAEDEVITYIGRNLEPYRGFHQLMKAIAIINKKRPKAHILIVGSDGVSYGSKPENGETYKDHWLKRLPINLNQVHFLGRLTYEDYLNVLQISSAHIYLTVPFVLSWSMLEAMSAGCVVLGSNTSPVLEVIKDGENGILVDYFSPEDIANKTIEVLKNKNKYGQMRTNARNTILEHYSTASGIQQYKDLIAKHIKRENL